MHKEKILQAYAHAKEQYAALGVDTDDVLKKLDNVNISLHCWQTDDVGGFETPDLSDASRAFIPLNYQPRATSVNQ